MRALVLCALAVALSQAASITWTGIAEDNQWFNHINWSPDQVPGPNDDVTIPSGVVQVTQATGVNSLQMGTLVEAPANLTLFQAFVVGNGGMQVQSNGNLIINTGLQQVFGQITIGGTLEFIDGTLGGAWTIAPRAYANLGNANMKGFSGCSFTSQGQLSLGGVIVLNQSSTFSLQSPTTANTDLIIQNGDGSQVNFDASGAAFTYSTGTFTIQAPVTLGQYTLQSGNMTILDSMSFTSSFNVPANSFVAVLGNAALNASAGFTGAGVVTFGSTSATIGSSSFGGYVNLIGGDVVFTAESDIAVLTVQGGNAVFMAKMWPAQLNLISGTTAGTGVAVAANLLVASKGFSLGSAIRANKTATFMASIVSFGTSAGLTIEDTANATVTGTLLLTGPPSVPGVTNNGAFLASAAVSSQNINIQGSGSFTVQNKLTIGSATFAQSKVALNGAASFSGTNSFLTIGKIENMQGGAVKGVLGSYTFSCPRECDNVNTPNTNPPTSGFSFSA